ncbi:MAG: histidine phosphatase family protein [Chloroflexi bacterium]|nr:histidine phosphatase family protein [Chloroflexota bacterium]
MTTTLLYVRHAEVFNPEDILYGRLPGWRLSDNGRYFADKLAGILSGEPLDTIYSSPLLRARQTARSIAKKHPTVAVHYREALAEVRTSWQGTRYVDIPDGKAVYELRRAASDETVEDVWYRMRTFCDELVRKHQGTTVLCVSHGDPIKLLSFGLQGKPVNLEAARQPDPARCSVTRITYENPSDRPDVTYTDYFRTEVFRKITDLAELCEGINVVEQHERKVLLHRLPDDRIFATDVYCPHMRTLLSEGCLSGTTLTCPFHGAQFNITTGEIERQPQTSEPLIAQHCSKGTALAAVPTGKLRTYQVKVQEGAVLLKVR